ncbi:Nuclear pore complex nucleoporin component, partial [Geranomyces michiganensis]
ATLAAQSPDILAGLRRSLQHQQQQQQQEHPSPSSAASSDFLPSPSQQQLDLERILEAKNEELRLAGEYGLELLINCKRADDINAELEQQVRTLREENKELTRSASRHERDLRNVETRQAELAVEMELKDEQIARLTRSLQKACKAGEERRAAEAHIDALVAQVAAATSLEGDIRRENTRLMEKITHLEARLKDAEAFLGASPLEPAAAPMEETSTTELEVLFALANELNLANAKLRVDIEATESLRERNETLQRDLDEAQALLANLRNELDLNNRRAVSSPIAIAGTSITATVRKSVFGELEDVVIRNTPPSSTWMGRPSPDLKQEPRRAPDFGQATPAARAPPQAAPLSLSPSLNDHVQELTRIGAALHQKLTTTDPHHLNRKLRRRFNIAQLSALSQTVIDSIQTGIQDLPSTFAGGTSTLKRPITDMQRDVYSQIFLPLLRLIQVLLEDLCRVKGTLNEYSLMYFEKISERAAGSCVNGSGQLRAEQQQHHPRTPPPSPRRAPSATSSPPPPRRAIQHQQMHLQVQHQHIELMRTPNSVSSAEGPANSPVSMSPTTRIKTSPTNHRPTWHDYCRARRVAKERDWRIQQSDAISRGHKQRAVRVSKLTTKDELQHAVEQHTAALRKHRAASVSPQKNDVQRTLDVIDSAFRPCLNETDAIDQELRNKLKQYAESAIEDHRRSLEDGLRQIKEKEEKRKAIEAAKAREETLRKEEERKKVAAAQRLAEETAAAARQQQAAETEAAQKKAAADSQAQQQAAEQAARDAEAKKQKEGAAAAAAAAREEASQFMPQEAQDQFAARLALVKNIKTKLKPLVASGENKALTDSVFKAKMNFTRRTGQIMNSEKKIIEIAVEINGTLKGAKAAGNECLSVCMDILAKQILKQAEGEVAVRRPAAFPIAILCVMLYRAYPEFLDILLGRMAKRCPYIANASFTKLPDEDAEAFRVRLGYRKVNDGWETPEQYGERMAGILTLYAAITQTTSLPDNQHGIEYAWLWLARTLNAKPRRVTALLILTMLEIVGFELLKKFGKQAEKLLVVLRDEFLPRNPKEAVASGTRLKLFLDEVFKTGRIPPPEGKTLAK